MSQLFIADTVDAWPDEEDSLGWLGSFASYFFLYPAIRRLQGRTGQLIDLQQRAFFSGAALEELAAFEAESRQLVLEQPSTWQQHVGQSASGSIYDPASRQDLLRFLDDLSSAIGSARKLRKGVLFSGCDY